VKETLCAEYKSLEACQGNFPNSERAVQECFTGERVLYLMFQLCDPVRDCMCNRIADQIIFAMLCCASYAKPQNAGRACHAAKRLEMRNKWYPRM
jgi:hypothetical protein